MDLGKMRPLCCLKAWEANYTVMQCHIPEECIFLSLFNVFYPIGGLDIVCVLQNHFTHRCGPGSSVSIATDYGLDGPGIESRWGRDFPPVQTGPRAHPASCTMGTGCF